MSKEVWDAYNKRGNKLGFDLYRGEKIPEDTYHIIVEVYVFTNEKEVLITQRHPNKPWGLKWEITGGSILKGETPKLGAVRELQEETGIVVNEDDLIPIYTVPNKDFRSIYYSFRQLSIKPKQRLFCRMEKPLISVFFPMKILNGLSKPMISSIPSGIGFLNSKPCLKKF